MATWREERTLRESRRTDRGGEGRRPLPVAALAERPVDADRERRDSPLPSPASHDYEDLQRELALIERKLDVPVTVDSENARSTRAILARQKCAIEAKLEARS